MKKNRKEFFSNAHPNNNGCCCCLLLFPLAISFTHSGEEKNSENILFRIFRMFSVLLNYVLFCSSISQSVRDRLTQLPSVKGIFFHRLSPPKKKKRIVNREKNCIHRSGSIYSLKTFSWRFFIKRKTSRL